MTPRPVGKRGVAFIMFHQSCDLLLRCLPSPNIDAGGGTNPHTSSEGHHHLPLSVIADSRKPCDKCVGSQDDVE
jgi:hypothetical protein